MELKTEWITIPQAMQVLHITSRTTLDKYTRKYNIRVSKPMGRVYLNHADILATIAQESVKMGI